jgi:hypothetical protein
MFTLEAINVNDALYQGLRLLQSVGVRQDSRVGPVLVSPKPVATEYLRPTQRVLFSPLRDANPFFHLVESLWMLAGHRDVATPATYAKQILAYSDDGVVMNAAYGWRWRRHFGFDQILHIIADLKKNPNTRRAVLAVWDGRVDLLAGAAGSKDLPCNTTVYFEATRGELNMTVCNRSNDIIWGAYGANAVHFSMLQEFIANAVGVPVGSYYQMSNNFHMYPGRPDVDRLMDTSKPHAYQWEIRYTPIDLYRSNPGISWPLLSAGEAAEEWLNHCEQLLSTDGLLSVRAPAFLRQVAAPVYHAHAHYRERRYADAAYAIEQMVECDWKLACMLWLRRRAANRDKESV